MDKVVLILVDGMRPDAVASSKAQYLNRLKSTSSYSFEATSIMPSVTLPCHTSLFFSTDPDRHGITTNTWTPPARDIYSFMDVARSAGLKTAMFYNWEWLRDLNRVGALERSDFWSLNLDYYANGETFDADIRLENEMTDRAISYFISEEPDVTFIYYGLLDEAGHYFGWLSDKYMTALENAEDCIKRIREALPENYNIIITADHGGHGRDHGKDIPEDMTIPMIFNGSRFEGGKQYESPNLKDIAPTILKILGLKRPPEWIGKELELK